MPGCPVSVFLIWLQHADLGVSVKFARLPGTADACGSTANLAGQGFHSRTNFSETRALIAETGHRLILFVSTDRVCSPVWTAILGQDPGPLFVKSDRTCRAWVKLAKGRRDVSRGQRLAAAGRPGAVRTVPCQSTLGTCHPT
jgi:hypothetical protein